MMKGRPRANARQPTMMIHHIREIQIRLLAIVAVLIGGMVVGYVFYEPLFEFIKAPLNGPLHYMSPAGSFTFIIKICLMIGVIAALPIAIYNAIMFIQPALAKRVSKIRIYITTLASFLLAAGGATFGFLVILPLALQFFYKFQVSGLEAIISADEYLRFVVGVIVTFVLIFQLPLLMSFIDYIRPLPPKKLLRAEKYVVIGSIVVAIVVPFAFDPTVQLLIASPIVVLYNVSIVIVAWQHYMRARHGKKKLAEPSQATLTERPQPIAAPLITPTSPTLFPKPTILRAAVAVKSLDGTLPARRGAHPQLQLSAPRPSRSTLAPSLQQSQRPRKLITDMRMPIHPQPRVSSKTLAMPRSQVAE